MQITLAEETWKDTPTNVWLNGGTIFSSSFRGWKIARYILSHKNYSQTARERSLKVLIYTAKKYSLNCRYYCTTPNYRFLGALFDASFEYSLESILSHIVSTPLLQGLEKNCSCAPKTSIEDISLPKTCEVTTFSNTENQCCHVV